MPTTLHIDEPIDWKDALVLVAFPTAGNAGNIAGHYIRKHLMLPLLGSIHIEGAPGVAAVDEGLATAPLRVYGGEVECQLGDGNCPTVYLIVTDLPLGLDGMHDLTKFLAEEAKGCRLVLCLDAVVREAGDNTPDVYATAHDTSMLQRLLSEHVKPLPGAILVGMSGHILLAAERGELPGAALLVEANKDVPDGHAGAALVNAIDHLIPQVKVDPGPLKQEAAELERIVRQTQEGLEGRDKRSPFSSYI